MLIQSVQNKIHKNIVVWNSEITALVDTGSEVSIMRSDCYKAIGSPHLMSNNVTLSGIADKKITPLGFFNTEIYMDDIMVRTNIYVLENFCCEVAIGMDVLNQLNFTFSENNIAVTSKSRNCANVNLIRKSFLNIETKPINYRIGIATKTDENINKQETRNKHEKSLAPASSTKKEEKCFDSCDEQSEKNNRFLASNEFFVSLAEAVNEEQIDLAHILDQKQKKRLLNIIQSYKPNKTENTMLKMNIVLHDEIPVNQRPRRLSLTEQKLVEQQIREWLDEGIIKPSFSDFASPIVLCKKKNGSTRLCIDFRKLNRKIVKDRFPLPLIEDVLDHLAGAQVFTSLDLKNGFFHVDVDTNSTKYTSFVTHEGQYEFLKTPYGLCNGPSVFQRYIYHVFRDLLNDHTLEIYLDDIIIPSYDEEEGIDKLQRVLEVASRYGLELNFKKCNFLQRKVEFLGYVLEKGTIKPSPSKTIAVKKFPEPKTTKQVQSFLGLTGYFRKFIPEYAKIAKPMSDLLRDSVHFRFGPEQKEAFIKLKEILSRTPVLNIFKQGYALELHTDASSHGFGACLLQKSEDGTFHPIQYMSKKTTHQQEKYCSYELEMLAVIEALKKFRHYLLGTKFKIVTDCAAFQKTMDKKELTPKIARWALFLEEFNYEVIHRPGAQMKHVDALSRNTILVVTRSHDAITSKIASSQAEDEFVATIKTLLEKGEEHDYLVKNEVLYKLENGRELCVVPQLMQLEIIKSIHNKGHFAASKTEEVLRQDYYIPKARKQIESVIANCIHCILCNKKRGKGEGLLNPIPKENVPLSTFHIDFIGPLTSTNKRYQYIFTVVDAFTKFTWFYPVKSTSSQNAIDKLKLQQTIFGNPSRIISDRGSAFTSKDFDDYCIEQGIEHVKITTGIPRGNGQIERIHSILIPVLTKLTIEDPSKWYKHVGEVQRIINSTIARSIKYTPFELLIGIKMKNKEDVHIKQLLEAEYLKCVMQDRDNMREEAKDNILKLQQENCQQYNRKRKRPHLYKVNDLVAIQRTQFGSGLKLRAKFHGPYRVKTVKPNQRYDVEKVDNCEGPNLTSTAADHMKLWSAHLS